LFHVAAVTLKQAMEVAFGGVFDRAGPALKTGQIGAEVVFKVGECRLDQSGNGFGILRPSWKFKTSVNSFKTTGCILSHDSIRWLGGQSDKVELAVSGIQRLLFFTGTSRANVVKFQRFLKPAKTRKDQQKPSNQRSTFGSSRVYSALGRTAQTVPFFSFSPPIWFP
jgi:hypothetical protein